MMTEQEINVAIAEAVGWRFVREFDGTVIGKKPNEYGWSRADFASDLNAINKAVLYADARATAWNAPDGRNDTFQDAYLYHLKTVCKCGDWSIVHATARQRAEAFLRTVGRWTE